VTRPLRTLAVAAIGVAFWAGWRGAAVRDELAAEFTPVAARSMPKLAPSSPTFPTPQAPPLGPPPIGTPEVMVYSYPAPPGGVVAGSPPPRLWRLDAKQLARQLTARTDAEYSTPIDSGTRPSARLPIAPPRAREAGPDMRAAAYEAASRGYADLRVGDRRGAAGAFAVALSLAPDHPSAKLWSREAKLLSKHWRAEVYTFLRQADGTRVPLPAASPVLGAGSTAATLAYTLNPLSRRTVELQARFITPYRGFSSPDGTSAQGAAGIAVRPFPKVPITLVAERLFKLGPNARNDFQARMTAGLAKRVHGFDLSAFGEADFVGRRPDWFAGAQLIAERPIRVPGGFRIAPGLGLWSAMQRTDTTSTRVEIGPSLRLVPPKGPLSLSVDYRVKMAGNARPGSGVAVTVGGRF